MNEPAIPRQQRRENPEPYERARPIPWYMLVLVAATIAFGIVYILASDVDTPGELGDERSLAELRDGGSSAGAGVDGAAVYAARCAACHQATGQGLPGVFPPLAGSEWVVGKDTTAVAIVMHGVTGRMTVNGVAFDGAMPPFREQLSDAEVAAVVSYIRSQWGNSATHVTADAVAQFRIESAARSGPFNGDAELAAIK